MRRATTPKRSAIASSTTFSDFCERARPRCSTRWSARICRTSRAVRCRSRVRCSLRAGDPAGPAKIHVLGLLIMQYPQGSPWERVFGWRFVDPWEAVEPYARGLPDGEMLVVLSHVGLSLDTELAKRVPRIDLLLGGHSHDTLGSAALCRRRADRSRRAVRALRLAQRARLRRAARAALRSPILPSFRC